MAKEETQAVSSAPEEKVVEPKLVTIDLGDTILINNGEKVQVYTGKVTVDEATADDLLRRQREVFKGDEMRLNGMDRTSGKIGEI